MLVTQKGKVQIWLCTWMHSDKLVSNKCPGKSMCLLTQFKAESSCLAKGLDKTYS